MSDSSNIENKVDEKNSSAFEKIVQYVVNFIVCFIFSGAIAFGVKYWILQLPFDLNITAHIIATVVFIAAFRFFHKKFKNDARARPSRNISNFTPSDLSNPANPFSFTTPGGPLYMSDWSDRDHFNENRIAFYDSDNYYNR